MSKKIDMLRSISATNSDSNLWGCVRVCVFFVRLSIFSASCTYAWKYIKKSYVCVCVIIVLFRSEMKPRLWCSFNYCSSPAVISLLRGPTAV